LGQVRIVLVELRGILHDVIRGIVEVQQDMAVVGDLERADDLQSTIAETGPAFVIWGVQDDVSEFYPEFLHEWPEVRVLAVEGEGRQSFLWEMRPTRAPLGELSPGRLIAALRTVGGQ
jgi:hypothetical protein